MPRLRHPHAERADQAPRRLHDAALLVLGRPDHPREPRVRRAHLPDARPPAKPWSEALESLGLAKPREPARRVAIRRLEAAPRARRLPAARAQAAAARRAHRRRRPDCAPRFLGRDSTGSRRDGIYRARHARITWTKPSAATSSPISRTASCSRRGTGDEVIESQNLDYMVDPRRASGARWSRSCARLPGVDQTVVIRRRAACQRARSCRHWNARSNRPPRTRRVRMEPIETGLEDVFIYLMSHSRDNFGARA